MPEEVACTVRDGYGPENANVKKIDGDSAHDNGRGRRDEHRDANAKIPKGPTQANVAKSAASPSQDVAEKCQRHDLVKQAKGGSRSSCLQFRRRAVDQEI